MHEGHRKRMYEKLKNNDGLLDHEILEILLFNAVPRKNTNPIAHNLLNTFGSLGGVFNATHRQLLTVDGVGESVAAYLKCIAEGNRRISADFAGIAVIKNHSDLKRLAAARLRGKIAEFVEIYCMDKSGKVLRVHSFTNDDLNSVTINTNKITEVLVTDKPYGIAVAHNHLSGSSAPSQNDDKFTAQIQFLCSMNNVVFYDHIVYASDKDIFSYFDQGKLEKIKRELSFNRVLDDKIEKLFGPVK